MFSAVFGCRMSGWVGSGHSAMAAVGQKRSFPHRIVLSSRARRMWRSFLFGFQARSFASTLDFHSYERSQILLDRSSPLAAVFLRLVDLLASGGRFCTRAYKRRARRRTTISCKRCLADRMVHCLGKNSQPAEIPALSLLRQACNRAPIFFHASRKMPVLWPTISACRMKSYRCATRVDHRQWVGIGRPATAARPEAHYRHEIKRESKSHE